MLNGTIEHVVKHSILYSYVLSQPLATYVDAYPELQNKILLKTEQLEYGEHGESVRLLQKKLNKLSYFEDEIDGEFDLLTEHALKKFQADHNITINGQADKETIYALIKIEKKKYIAQLEDIKESIYPGMHGEEVKIAQKALQYFGYYDGELDGIYGPLTKNALKIAEEEHGIEMNEEITKEALTALYDKPMDEEVEEEKAEVKVETKSKQESKEKEVKKVEVKGSNNKDVIQAAKSFIGTPYTWGGTSPGGFDCSGFIQYVYQTQSISTPRTVSDTWNFAQPVSSASVGDLVFFETYKPGPSHMGIYLGDGKFIHAGESRGVEISDMNNSYWGPKYLGAKRVN
ncbi:NlpC/P60 family protein [Virgibacillus sp. C22-A2]|uniref:NlpC/P60 family protein n=1 Tax=Virgibacillus tibetensis TaxID=3042313 RepID=A0ABU6KB07_9BACI|nr:NlpC/P60 family protein [Virgibacillus sp. C22-A2]